MTKCKKQTLPKGVIISPADHTAIVGCKGCGFWLVTEARLQTCKRCGMRVCRVCAEDRPHTLSLDGAVLCELPAGQAPKTWGNDPAMIAKYKGWFTVEPEDKPVRASTKE